MLSLLLQLAINSNVLRAYKPSPQGPSFTHLFFTNDCLLVTRASIRDCVCLKLLLDLYCILPCQSINIHKSYITFSPSTDPTIKYQIVHLLETPLRIDPWIYLSVPLSGGRLNASSFVYLLHQVESRIESWQ